MLAYRAVMGVGAEIITTNMEKQMKLIAIKHVVVMMNNCVEENIETR